MKVHFNTASQTEIHVATQALMDSGDILLESCKCNVIPKKRNTTKKRASNYIISMRDSEMKYQEIVAQLNIDGFLTAQGKYFTLTACSEIIFENENGVNLLVRLFCFFNKIIFSIQLL